MILAASNALDTQTLIEWVSFYRPGLELVAVVVGSALVGFLTARAMYRSKVATRTTLLGFTQNRWRRKLSRTRSETEAATRERDRAQRRAKTASRPGVATPA
jgi:outer membrane murein-binding lipoprotein Lpp